MSDYYEDTPYYYYSTPTYYEDNPHHQYSVPTHHEDTSYSYNMPSHYDDSPPDLVYHDDYTPDLVYHDDYTPDLVYHDDPTSDFSYHDNAPTVLIQANNTSYDDSSHSDLSYYSHTSAYNEDNLADVVPEFEDIRAYEDDYPQLEGDLDLDFTPPVELLPFHNALNERLTDITLIYEALLDEMIAWDREDAEAAASGKFPLPAQPYSKSPRFEELTALVQQAKAASQNDISEDCSDGDKVDDDERVAEHNNDVCGDEYEGEVHPQTPLFHHLSPIFLITTEHRKPCTHLNRPTRSRHFPKPKPHNIRKIRTNTPPGIRPPKPRPIAPNITTQSHLHSLTNQHSPDIRTPKPIPPKPNIVAQPHTKSQPQTTTSQQLEYPTYQQPRRPPLIRPQRKHPPARPLIIPTPQNCHLHAKRRISKRVTRHRCPRTNITWRGPDAPSVPFPISPFSLSLFSFAHTF